MDKLVNSESKLVDSGLFEHAPGSRYLHLLRELLLTYRQLLRQLAVETGLSGAQAELLRELALRGGSSTGSALARELGVDPAAVSRVIAGVEDLGLVSRVRDDRDGRRRLVALTEDGRRRMVALHEELHKRESALAGAIDPQSLETAVRVLRALRDAAGPTAPLAEASTRKGTL